jgi:hypothetical protein
MTSNNSKEPKREAAVLPQSILLAEAIVTEAGEVDPSQIPANASGAMDTWLVKSATHDVAIPPNFQATDEEKKRIEHPPFPENPAR